MEDSQDVGCTQHSVRTGGENHGSEDSGGQEVYLQMDETCSPGSPRLESQATVLAQVSHEALGRKGFPAESLLGGILRNNTASRK